MGWEFCHGSCRIRGLFINNLIDNFKNHKIITAVHFCPTKKKKVKVTFRIKIWTRKKEDSVTNVTEFHMTSLFNTKRSNIFNYPINITTTTMMIRVIQKES